MDKLMQAMAPKGVWGFCLRLVLLVGVVAVANFVFSHMVSDHHHPPSYFIAHAMFVGGPLIAFFLAVTVFQIRLQRKLSRLSRQDGLTGLNNRRSFFDLVERVRETPGENVLLVLDADRFKDINDTYGHLAGDRCLKYIAKSIRREVRKDDIVGRLGGEEFAIFLKATSLADARAIGERLTAPIAFPTTVNGADHFVTLSVGGAMSHEHESIDTVFVNADRALYQAKREGRARMVFSEPGIAA